MGRWDNVGQSLVIHEFNCGLGWNYCRLGDHGLGFGDYCYRRPFTADFDFADNFCRGLFLPLRIVLLLLRQLVSVWPALSIFCLPRSKSPQCPGSVQSRHLIFQARLRAFCATA